MFEPFPKYIEDRGQAECPFCKTSLKQGASICSSCNSKKIDVGFVVGKTAADILAYFVITVGLIYGILFMDILAVIFGEGELEPLNWFFNNMNVPILDIRVIYDSVLFRIAIGFASTIYLCLWLAHTYEFIRALRYGAGATILWVRPKSR